ncbi:hypothetical protein KP509_07G091100 [Ceratopteris richardii]|uniref:Bifunctional inhibitor/plant lipid transfer protein/seed storage helical domain-containing protein n=1 Tax=Ceratopteris richardii TaxID=49495 RepID=A0A8T2UJ65_CERRI|nr:hypothetical protein KP509_07G091100 [Ceratopteris richardii]
MSFLRRSSSSQAYLARRTLSAFVLTVFTMLLHAIPLTVGLQTLPVVGGQTHGPLFQERAAIPSRCKQVMKTVAACKSYLTTGTPAPMPGSRCCVGVLELDKTAFSSVAARRKICSCLVDVSMNMSFRRETLVDIHGYCSIPHHYVPVNSTSVDCSKIT